MATVSSKLCRGCKLEKPATAFTPDRRTSTGLYARCRECLNAANRSGPPQQKIVPDPEKVCTKCGILKPLFRFPPRCSRASGYQSYCRSCKAEQNKTEAARKAKAVAAYRHRAKNVEQMRACYLKYHYGLTLRQYDEMSESQGHVCKLCGKHDRTRYKRLKIDHCHKTGRIRGLLCGSCNTALGILGDSPDALQRAFEYVKG